MTDILYSSVSCAEKSGSRSEVWTPDGGWKMSVILQCADEDRFALLDDLVSTPRAWPYGDTGAICLDASIVPLEAAYDTLSGNQAMTYQIAEVSANFGILNQNEDEESVTERLEPLVEFNLLDYRYFNWTDNSGDQLLEAEAPGVQIFSCYLVRQYSGMASIPAIYLSGIGKVHNADYTSAQLGLTFEAESLLLCPDPLEKVTKSDGSASYNFTVRFAYKVGGWNKYLRSKTGAFEEIFSKASGSAYKSYPPTDLIALLG